MSFFPEKRHKKCRLPNTVRTTHYTRCATQTGITSTSGSSSSSSSNPTASIATVPRDMPRVSLTRLRTCLATCPPWKYGLWRCSLWPWWCLCGMQWAAVATAAAPDTQTKEPRRTHITAPLSFECPY
ncbi:hypothetical protein [Banggai cardinalfish iridovirus]|uniref:Uncharacterized protein n=1 Tax=Banggai cardinalfish iridovirus TaxID=565290 RepID=A0A6M3QS69_ISKNV|nr:hypothetical protein [Banggai cardinalfish iridovirus]UWH18807.1 ORF019 [Infectious spleen and kidney necrosis virus]